MEATIDNSKTQTQTSQSSISPDQAMDILMEGNRRFVNNEMINRDLRTQVADTTGGQYPFAAVLGCIDSRVPSETVFDQGIGDIFNARIAGNFVNDDILGSLEFACKVAGAKAILIMGHTSCGAVKGAIGEVELGNLTGMLKKIRPAVEDVNSNNPGADPASADYINSVASRNVELAISNLLERSDVLREMHDNGEITVKGAMYDVGTGKVNLLG